MGRGRQKAKQTKVARKLKYSTPETDLQALERELASRGGSRELEDYEPAAVEIPSATDDDDWR